MRVFEHHFLGFVSSQTMMMMTVTAIASAINE
jgi:hypothetical protein